MVERILNAHLLPRQKLWQHPSPKNGLPASCSLQAASCTIGMSWLMDCPPLPPPADFKGDLDYQVVWAEETVVLAKALQRCAVCSGMPLGMLCGAVQELHQSITSMIQIGNLPDLEILDVAEKDHVAPTFEGRAPLLMPRVYPPVSVTTPSELSALEPEQAAPPEELTLVPRQRPPPPPGFSLPWQMHLTHPHQSRQTGPCKYPREPSWILPSWGPYRWLYHIFQWQVRCIVSTSPRLLTWCPWSRHLYCWRGPHSQISLTLRKSSEWMQCSLPNPQSALTLIDS